MSDAGGPARRDRIGLWEAVAIAVGTMIGASIFSIFGLGARLAGPNLPLVFVLSGALAYLVAYSYAHLGARIVSDAGPMEYILRAFGDSHLTGTLAILMWFSYAISIALFAKGFAGYFLPLVGLDEANTLALGITEVAVVALFTALNFFGSQAVGRAEFYIVLVKLGVLGLFVVVGIWTVDPGRIAPVFDARYTQGLLYGVAVFFLSYMGFGLVTNASEHMQDPKRNVPRAIYISIAVVAVVYVSVAVVAVGNLPLTELVRTEDYALAEAARPFLGQWGYLLVSLGALFSIASALNATLYGGANVAYALARDGQLPRAFERKVWFGAPEGLYITAATSLVFALFLDLGGVASVTSAVFILIYLFVIASHYTLRDLVGGRRGLVVFSFFAVTVVFGILLAYQWRSDRAAFHATWMVLAGAGLVEWLWRGLTRRHLHRRGRRLGAQPETSSSTGTALPSSSR